MFSNRARNGFSRSSYSGARLFWFLPRHFNSHHTIQVQQVYSEHYSGANFQYINMRQSVICEGVEHGNGAELHPRGLINQAEMGATVQ
jgi:hypothetical protein